MNIDVAPVVEDARSLLAVVQGSCAVRNRSGFVNWMQGEIQEFIPHDVVIVAWGDLEGGALSFDVIPTGGIGEVAVGAGEIKALLAATFRKWLASDQLPVSLDLSGAPGAGDFLRTVAPWITTGVAHGLKDRRGRVDCLYLFLGRSTLATARVQEHLRLLLPSIDAGARQAAVSLPARVAPAPVPLPVRSSGVADVPLGELSAREVEVMGWVRMGKTNSEIALIMNLSTFTIKNHMRRIYKKLDVLNRAQAVGRFGASVAGLQDRRGVRQQQYGAATALEHPHVLPLSTSREALGPGA